VTLTDRTNELAQLHLAGPNAAAVLAAVGIDAGEWKLNTFRMQGPGLTVRCVDPLGLPGYDLVCPMDEVAELWNKLGHAGARPAHQEVWEILRVEAGTPVFGIDMDDTTFAPEVSRTARAISYNKGCYLGQEPIVMARDRGVVQRGFVGLLVGDEPVPAGSTLHRDAKEVGRVTSSARSPARGQAVALAYVRRGSQTPGTVLEVDVGGTRRKAEVTALPMV